MKTKFLHVLARVLYVLILLHKNHILCIRSLSGDRSLQRYCGDQLTYILDTLCQQYQYVPENYKRSSPIENDYIVTKPDNPFLNERYALSTFFRRNRRDPVVGAYTECCATKGCDQNELLQYCRT